LRRGFGASEGGVWSGGNAREVQGRRPEIRENLLDEQRMEPFNPCGNRGLETPVSYLPT
jgi:hypothetical protein